MKNLSEKDINQLAEYRRKKVEDKRKNKQLKYNKKNKQYLKKYRKTYKGRLIYKKSSDIYRKTPRGRFVMARANAKKKYGINKEEFNKFFDNGCMECGFNEEFCLDFHHLDGNRKNNSKNNLKYLCPNCHSRYHRISIIF